MNKGKYIKINDRLVGSEYPPFVIAEIGINHEGDLKKAKKMTKDAAQAGVECVKFQHHILEDEMVTAAKNVIPGNTDVSIWEVMEKCVLTIKQHEELKKFAEDLGLIYLCTPFSRKAADELEEIGVNAYKIGSGECNNYPLIEHIAAFNKPILLSTGMNDIHSIEKAVKIIEKTNTAFAILHCTSMYPTPYNKMRLGAINELKEKFNVPTGLSDHSIGNYTCFGAVALGASILEKHFTSDKSWPGPDISISIDPAELRELIIGSKAIYEARGGHKEILPEEKPTINFAYACVVSLKDIKPGEKLSKENIWVKRPGTGEIKAVEFNKILGKRAIRDIKKDSQIKYNDLK